MVTITAAELQNSFGRWRDRAQKEPVSVTHHGRESVVVLSADEYKRLKSLDTRQAFYAHELPDEVVRALERAEYPSEGDQFNHEYK